ncbi:PTS transporter subunit EIIB [Pseudomonas protegens]|uniref:PTS transporter subunit EIIB n=1 Tax=Pseudomonas protegens TaxID=380021 RepID=A0A7G8YJR2_9PSED|nr:PTS transporter subunit EIIB [Pseudomonas protegens]MDP9528297.1 PTS transporter subunit EIIB [Pseudomonas protegens]QNH75912.1 PTS transporter subunit EIIB [Pseudomonas protegens]QNL05106.1 PTS transporter subunit EIIB [Pseudomonas protegens]RBJ79882.1 PTS glucose transporter subunit IIB [Pseudomonas sp. MWU12-2534b]
MFEKLQRAFWKALTPDLIPDQPKAPTASASRLNAAMLQALGGSANIKSQQPLALTRLRLELHDPQLLDASALRVAGVPAVMPLAGGVVHLLLGLQG